ncbi:MAG: hypothetical protein ABTQ25_00235 [Nitrosomonas ureae]|jgi:primase-polymerase (primpol)-like protein|nr:hypothetical protein [Nitrospira sp.]
MSLFSKTKTHPGTQQETNPTPRQEIAEPTTDPQRQPSPQSAVKPLLGGKHPRGTSRFRTPYCVVIRASGTNCGSDITFRKLFLGTAQVDYSVAVAELCNTLAYWTNCDPDQMDGVFRKSGLMRPVWDEVDPSTVETYSQRAINKAIAECQETCEEYYARRSEKRKFAQEFKTAFEKLKTRSKNEDIQEELIALLKENASILDRIKVKNKKRYVAILELLASQVVKRESPPRIAEGCRGVVL